MSCDCRDGNGSLLDQCLGVCEKSKEIRFNSYIQDIQNQLSIIRNNQDSVKLAYQEGFKDGFKMGLDPS